MLDWTTFVITGNRKRVCRPNCRRDEEGEEGNDAPPLCNCQQLRSEWQKKQLNCRARRALIKSRKIKMRALRKLTAVCTHFVLDNLWVIRRSPKSVLSLQNVSRRADAVSVFAVPASLRPHFQRVRWAGSLRSRSPLGPVPAGSGRHARALVRRGRVCAAFFAVRAPDIPCAAGSRRVERILSLQHRPSAPNRPRARNGSGRVQDHWAHARRDFDARQVLNHDFDARNVLCAAGTNVWVRVKTPTTTTQPARPNPVGTHAHTAANARWPRLGRYTRHTVTRCTQYGVFACRKRPH